MSRTRSIVLKNQMNTSLPTTYHYTDTLFECDGSSRIANDVYYDVWVSNTYPMDYHEKTMTDVEIPNFHRRSANGEIFINPLTQQEIRWKWTPVERVGCYHYYKNSCDPPRELLYKKADIAPHFLNTMNFCSEKLGFDPVPSVSGLPDTDTCRDKAISQAWGNVSQEDILALVSLAEADKTLDTITSVSRKALTLIKGTRKKALKAMYRLAKNKKARRQLYRDLSDMYLEARYGLRPLYYDIVGIAKAAKSLCDPSGKHDRITARGYESISGSTTDTKSMLHVSGLSGAKTTITCDFTDRWEVEARAGVLAQVTIDVNAIAGLGLLGQTAWELVPFSFIVDWFLNTADIVASWSPNPHARTLGSWVTLRSTVSREGRLTSFNTDTTSGTVWGSLNQYFTGGTFSAVVKKVERIPSPSKPIIPSWDIRLDPFKLLDIGAIASNFRKESRELKTISSRNSFLRF